MNYSGLDGFLLDALKEDAGTGDVTTNSCVPEDAVSKGAFIAKQDGIICGLGLAEHIFSLIDKHVVLKPLVNDGCFVEQGEILSRISGPSRSILLGERLALNFLQHLSGIATAAKKASDSVKGTGACVVDTRKTTPGLRVLEKYAVRCGGAQNHRFSLSDGVLIKDNHIVAAGGIAKAIAAARSIAPHTLKIEVEAENLAQVQECLDAGADIIMLDNMSVEDMKAAVRLAGGKAVTEASGNMGGRDLREVAETGVGYISVGALTHSVTAMDISLEFSK